MAKALSHPVRVRALTILNERVASSADIARDMDLPVANVAYHVHTLLRLKCIEEVETRQVRGALEHRYRALRRPMLVSEDTERMPASARNSFAGQFATKAFGDLRAAVESGTFEQRTDPHVSWTPLILDEQGWKLVYELLAETLDHVLQEQAAAAGRLQDGESGGPEVRSRLTMMHYEAPPAR